MRTALSYDSDIPLGIANVNILCSFSEMLYVRRQNICVLTNKLFWISFITGLWWNITSWIFLQICFSQKPNCSWSGDQDICFSVGIAAFISCVFSITDKGSNAILPIDCLSGLLVCLREGDIGIKSLLSLAKSYEWLKLKWYSVRHLTL